MSKTISVDVYRFNELKDGPAKQNLIGKARQIIEELNFWDYIDCVKAALGEVMPNSDFTVQASLTYSQGDGVNLCGTTTLKDLYYIGKQEDDTNDSELHNAIDESSFDIALSENHRYSYSCKNIDMVDAENNAYRAVYELFPDAYAELTPQKVDDYARAIATIIKRGLSILQDWEHDIELSGYHYVYDLDDSAVESYWDDNWFFINGAYADEFVEMNDTKPIQDKTIE